MKIKRCCSLLVVLVCFFSLLVSTTLSGSAKFKPVEPFVEDLSNKDAVVEFHYINGCFTRVIFYDFLSSGSQYYKIYISNGAIGSLILEFTPPTGFNQYVEIIEYSSDYSVVSNSGKVLKQSGVTESWGFGASYRGNNYTVDNVDTTVNLQFFDISVPVNRSSLPTSAQGSEADTKGKLSQIIDKISGIFTKIAELPRTIVDNIKGLFVPPDGELDNLQQSFQNQINCKLGVLGQVKDLFSGFTDLFSGHIQNSIPFPALEFQSHTVINAQNVRVVPVRFNSFMTYVRMATSIILIFSFVNGMRKRLDEFLGGSSV